MPDMVRLALSAILICGGLQKICFPHLFLEFVQNYNLLSIKQSLLAAILLPWLETGLGFCLATDKFQNGAHLLTIALGLIFSLAQISVLMRGMNIPCGCLSLSMKDNISISTVLRSLFLPIGGTLVLASRFINRASGS